MSMLATLVGLYYLSGSVLSDPLRFILYVSLFCLTNPQKEANL